MLNTVGTLVMVAIFLVLSIPKMHRLERLKKTDPLIASEEAQEAVVGIFQRVLKWIGVTVEVYGVENIPEDEAVLFVSNHRSYFDILVAYVYTPKILGFIAKSEIERIPLLSNWMHLVNCLFLDRKDMKKGLQTILAGIDSVRHGVSIWICPEGTRNKNPDPNNVTEFKEGSLKIAEKSGAKIVPVSISGTAGILEKQYPRMKKGHVIIEFGVPIDIQKVAPEEKKRLGAMARAQIIQMQERNNK